MIKSVNLFMIVEFDDKPDFFKIGLFVLFIEIHILRIISMIRYQ